MGLLLSAGLFLGLAQGFCQRIPVVRIGLASMGSPASFQVSCSAGFAAYDPAKGDLVAEWRPSEVVSVLASGDSVSVNGRGFGAIYFTGEADRLKLIGPAAARNYRGWLYITAHAGKLVAVNELGLESYLMGVVPCEMSPAWHPEALKAQAIAARTYTITRIGAFAKEGFDVDDTTRCHTYRGADVENPKTNEAIRLTSNQILIYNGKPIEALYATVSGGVTASAAEAFGGIGQPYLASIRDVDPSGKPYAAGDKSFYWSKEFSNDSFAKVFPGRVYEIQDLRIEGRGASGRVTGIVFTVKFDGEETAWEVNVGFSKLRQALGADVLCSSLFVITKTESGWRFDGKGWGHGVGMCQAGANGRAKAGQSCEQILKAYYTGVELLTVRGSPIDLATRGSKVDRRKFSKNR